MLSFLRAFLAKRHSNRYGWTVSSASGKAQLVVEVDDLILDRYLHCFMAPLLEGLSCSLDWRRHEERLVIEVRQRITSMETTQLATFLKREQKLVERLLRDYTGYRGEVEIEVDFG